MMTKRWIQCRWVSGLVALTLTAAAPGQLAGQVAAPSEKQADDAAGFKEFSDRVQAYLRLQKSVDSGLPKLKPTDLPEMIAAHQHVLARKIREARPHAKSGDIFTSDARDAFRRASLAALGGPRSASSRAYMKQDAPNPGMRLVVNGIYPDTEPITTLPPVLLAAFPPLPDEVAYRVVGRTLILVDVESRLVVDIAKRILPSAS
jgi:hypothetical protein